MPYGRPSSTGHGYRRPDYIWSPVLMPCARRRRRKSSTAHSRLPSTHAKGKKEIAGDFVLSTLDGLVDILFSHPLSKTSIDLLAGMFLVAVMSLSMTTMALVLIPLLCQLSKESIGYATNEIVKDYKERMKAILIKRKTSVNPPPTAEAIRKAWEASRTSLMGKLLVGTLLSDLEPVVDQSYIRSEDGTIVGRRPGIKGWLFLNCPDMLPHYKALMNYKALADKLRKALGIEDPDTLAGVLDFSILNAQHNDDKPVASGGTGGETSAKKVGAKDGKTQGKSPKMERIQPKSLAFLEEFRLLKSNRQYVMRNIHSVFPGESMEKMPKTIAALDAVLRERLGLIWMQRGKKRPLVA